MVTEKKPKLSQNLFMQIHSRTCRQSSSRRVQKTSLIYATLCSDKSANYELRFAYTEYNRYLYKPELCLIPIENIGAEFMRAALYARVSTDGQSTENQLRELRAVAKKMKWKVAEEFVDNGFSGAKGRDQRPAFDALLKAATRREFDIVMSWSVDRLGRSLQHLVGFLGDIHAKDIGLYLHQQGIDTTSPSGKAMFGMLGVFAEFERAMIQERVKAGLNRARASGKTLGRPRIDAAVERKIVRHRRKGRGIHAIAKEVGVGTGTVQRIVAAMQ